MRTGKRAWILRAIVLTTTTLGASSCTPELTTSTAAAVSAAPAGASGSRQLELALGDLARGVAIAMQDANVRAYVGTSMRQSRAKAHALSMRRMTREFRSAAFIQAIATSLGRSPNSISSLIETLPSLTFIVPVLAHRQSWRGNGDILVAASLTESHIVGYNARGDSVPLSTRMAPDQIVFALVAEPFPEDLGVTAPAGVSALIGDGCDPYAIIECDSGPGGGGGGPAPGPSVGVVPASAPSGLYMTYADVDDYGESWIRGSPELEIHVVGKDNSGGGPLANSPFQFVRSASCSGANQPGVRYYDQNDHKWSGSVLVLADTAAARLGWVTSSIATATQSQVFQIEYWEDDEDACAIKAGSDYTARQFLLLAGGVTFVWTNRPVGGVCDTIGSARWCDGSKGNLGLQAIGAGFAVYSLWNLIAGDADDGVGTVLANSAALVRFPWYVPPAGTTHTLVKEVFGVFVPNGGVRLVEHTQGSPSS
jgi:hypothetical protein